MPSQTEKAMAFRALHERPGAFIIPNPWDAGTATAGRAGVRGTGDDQPGAGEHAGPCDSVGRATR